MEARITQFIDMYDVYTFEKSAGFANTVNIAIPAKASIRRQNILTVFIQKAFEDKLSQRLQAAEVDCQRDHHFLISMQAYVQWGQACQTLDLSNTLLVPIK